MSDIRPKFLLFALGHFLVPVAPVAAAPPKPKAPITLPSSPNMQKDLPYAQGRSFKTLDEYLAWRRRLGTMDRPFYEEIAPGVYRLVSGRRLPGQEDKLFTRQQLMEQFGFSQ